MAVTSTSVEANITSIGVSGVEADDSSQTFKIVLIFQLSILGILCQVINICGIISNIINITCLVKQGFKNPINVSLFGLAVSDLGCLITLVFTSLCIAIEFTELELPFNPSEFQYLISGMPHVAFSRVSSWITALIILERCLCISVPLKVQSLVTSRRVCITVILVFFTLLSSSSPVYVVNRLDWKFFPALNKTLIGIVRSDQAEDVDKISFIINNAIIPFSAFMIIIVCTVILVVKLEIKAQWRKKVGQSDQVTNVSKTNKKVSKMVVMISILFISCFIPIGVMFLAMALLPGFTIYGKYKNILLIVAGLCVCLESVNSSSNIFIYYHMSTKYREAFRQLFSLDMPK